MCRGYLGDGVRRATANDGDDDDKDCGEFYAEFYTHGREVDRELAENLRGTGWLGGELEVPVASCHWHLHDVKIHFISSRLR